MDELQRQVTDLQKRLDNYEQSSQLPRNFETSIRERLNLPAGQTLTITYVSDVTQDVTSKVITVVKKTMVFQNGILVLYT